MLRISELNVAHRLRILFLLFIVTISQLALSEPNINESTEKQVLLKQLEKLQSLDPASNIGIAADSYHQIVEGEIKSSDNASGATHTKKMKAAIENLKTAAITDDPRYSNKTFICKSDYDKCEPKASSWRYGPWSCEIAFTACLAEGLLSKGKD